MKKEVWRPAVEASPSARQNAWQALMFYGVVHFGMNTFTDSEWGSGGESPQLYAPENLNVRQWVRVAKNAGMHGLIVCAKHYDGFCLWHTAQTEHSVLHSPCTTDVVQEAAKECAAENLAFGVRIALWDRHDLRYGTGEAYETFFLAQLKELLTGYGELFCVWLDNTCGEGKGGRVQTMDMEKIYACIREWQPNAVIAGCGPDVRFSGNYIGFCRRAEWSAVPYYYAPLPPKQNDVPPPRKYGAMDLELGTDKKWKKGHRAVWYPAEVAMPMRKGWFYHETEKFETKPLSKLVDTWYAAVGGNACFMLGISPAPDGKICESDMQTLLNLGAQLSIDFGEDLAQDSALTSSGCTDGFAPENILTADERCWRSDAPQCWIDLDMLDDYDIDKVVLREAVQFGQRIGAFTIFGDVDGKWKKLYTGATVGYKTICRFAEEVRVRHLRVQIDKTRGFAALSGMEAY